MIIIVIAILQCNNTDIFMVKIIQKIEHSLYKQMYEHVSNEDSTPRHHIPICCSLTPFLLLYEEHSGQ